MTAYRLTLICGPLRAVRVVDATSPEHAEYLASMEFTPRTRLARRVHEISIHRWTVVSCEPASRPLSMDASFSSGYDTEAA